MGCRAKIAQAQDKGPAGGRELGASVFDDGLRGLWAGLPGGSL